MYLKKGEFTTGQILGLILAVAMIVVLLYLALSFWDINWDKVDADANGYFGSFIGKINGLDVGDEARFSFWQDIGDKKEVFYFVYFGERTRVGDFYSIGNNENHICICYVKPKETVCNYCENLDKPVFVKGYLSTEEGMYPTSLFSDEFFSWYASDEMGLDVSKKEEGYYFEILKL